MSYKESILIPLREYRALEDNQIKKSKKVSINYLNSDQKVKLIEQKLLKKKGTTDYKPTIKPDVKEANTDESKNIVPSLSNPFPQLHSEDDELALEETSKLPRERLYASIPIAFHPFITSIVDYLDKNKEIISWDNDYNLKLKGKNIEDGNAHNIFKQLMKHSVFRKSDQFPKSTEEFYKTLTEIGIPKSWIPMQLPRTSLRLNKSEKTQSGKGYKLKCKEKLYSWLPY